MVASKREILFLIPSLAGGGAERVIVTLLQHLDRSKFNLALVVVNTQNAVYLVQIPYDVEFIDIAAKRVRYALPRITALIWKRRPDVVFSTLGHLNLALSIVRPMLPGGVRYIARETSIVSCALQENPLSAIWALLYRYFYKRYDLLVCQSRYMQADLVERYGFPSARSVVINNPIDVDFVQKKSNEPPSFPYRVDGMIRLVAAGRMSAEKGFDLLIEAVALLANPQIHLTLLGDGPLRFALERLVDTKGVANQIEFVGFQSNPYPWFASADAFVLSSRYEGFPNVVLEALACRTPVIALPSPGGTLEILGSIPECIVAKEISASALAKAIAKWLQTHRNRVGSSVVTPYSVHHIVSCFENILI